MSKPWPFEIHVLSDPKYLCAVRASVERLLERCGFDDATSGQVVLAVDEAMTNVIRHGYGDCHDKPIICRAKPGEREGVAGVWIEIEDESTLTSTDSIEPSAKPATEPGGLGVKLIYQVMDDVSYTCRRTGGGLLLTMFKGLPEQDVDTSGREAVEDAQHADAADGR